MKLMPSLTAKGWIASTSDKLDLALCHFYESEETATYLYPNQIADVHTIIASNTDDMDTTATELASRLESYLSTLFDEAKVQGVNVNRIANDPSGGVTIHLSVRVKDNGNFIERERTAFFTMRKFQKIVDLYNEGIGRRVY